MNYIDLGPAPAEEESPMIGADKYKVRAQRECRALINQLKRICGEPPPGVSFRIVEYPLYPDGLGSQYSVAVDFDRRYAQADAYASACDERFPQRWDSAALVELAVARRRGRGTTRVNLGGQERNFARADHTLKGLANLTHCCGPSCGGE